MFRCIMAVVALFAMLTVWGCGASEVEPSASAPAAPQVRFPTADALITHFNEVTTSTPPDLRAFMRCYYAETPLQERIGAVLNQFGPIIDLGETVRRVYGEDLPGGELFGGEPNGPARLTAHEGERARAGYKDHDGSQSELYLVKVGEEWWISGYTFEYDPEFRGDPKQGEENLTMLEKLIPQLAKAAPDLRRRVESGDLATYEDFTVAMGAVVIADVFEQAAQEMRSGQFGSEVR